MEASAPMKFIWNQRFQDVEQYSTDLQVSKKQERQQTQ